MKRVSEDRKGSMSSREPLTLEVTPSVPKAFIPKDSGFLGIKCHSALFIHFHFHNYFVTGSDVMISDVAASCFNYMIDEKNRKQGAAFVRVDKFSFVIYQNSGGNNSHLRVPDALTGRQTCARCCHSSAAPDSACAPAEHAHKCAACFCCRVSVSTLT